MNDLQRLELIFNCRSFMHPSKITQERDVEFLKGIAAIRSHYAGFAMQGTQTFVLSDSDAYAKSFHDDGYFICTDVVPLENVEALRHAVATVPEDDTVRRKQNVYGIRNLFQVCPTIRILASKTLIRQFVTPILGDSAVAVRAIFFDKVPGANWSLVWHQDNVIAVDKRVDLPGFAGWSRKAGVWHVEPPVEILANMVTIRIHLDDCGMENGPLRVITGSHRQRWTTAQVDDWKTRVPEVVCKVNCGGIVTMSPLILHASSASRTASHRRVIHFEYAASELPAGMDWSDRIGPS